tara:strand:+ start:7421 stop:8725 length:1305 start_codon:yes stop_codon:yes gene_type:complete
MKQPNRQAFGDAEQAAVAEVMKYYSSHGEDPPYQGRFERRFALRFEMQMNGGFAVPVATGTGACYLALAALKTFYNLPGGSEVILSPVTDSGPLAAIVALGFVPVIADAAPGSYNVNRQSIIDCVTDQTAAVFVVHAAGAPVEDIPKIAEDCASSGIYLVEDCSQAPFAMPKSVAYSYVGQFGDIAAFSTMYRKTIQSGGSGGLVYIKEGGQTGLGNHVLAHKDRGKQTWRSDLNQNDPSNALFPALNWNTDEFSCAIGEASVKRAIETIIKRNEFVAQLKKLLDKCSEVCSIPEGYHDGHSPFYLPIIVDEKKITVTKTEFAEAVQAEGVGLLPHYGCLVSDWEWAADYINWQPTQKYSEGHAPHAPKTPNARAMRDGSFNLFLNENYTKKDAVEILLAITNVEERVVKTQQQGGKGVEQVRATRMERDPKDG